MRVEICVIYTRTPLTDDDALERYSAVRGVKDLDRCIEPDPHIAAFLAELTDRYPRPGTLPQAEQEDSPWCADFNDSGGDTLLAMGGSHCADAVEYILDLAERHEIVCFDPETRSILAAPPGIHLETPQGGAIWPLTLITLTLALAGLLLLS